MPLCQRAARRLRRTRRPIRKNPPPQARTHAAPSAARSPAAGGQSVLLRGGYLRPNNGARLCTRSVGPRKPPSKHSAYVRTAARLPSQRQARPHIGKAALVNQRRLHARDGREARIRLLHLPLPYFFDFIRAPDGKRCGVRPYAGQSEAFCVQKTVFVMRNTAARRANIHIRRYAAFCILPAGTAAVSAADVRQNPPDRSARADTAARSAGSYGEASSRSTSIARRTFAFGNALPTRAAAAPTFSRGIRTAVCRICISSGSSKKAPDALQILLFSAPKAACPPAWQR